MDIEPLSARRFCRHSSLLVSRNLSGCSFLAPRLATKPTHGQQSNIHLIRSKLPEDVNRLWRLDNLLRAIRKAKKTELMKEWGIEPPVPSRSKEYAIKKKAFLTAKRKREAELEEILERIGWTPFRHTFGSLLAQAGVSIDKISSWMGNTPEVCRRHYAQFVPRDRRDGEIDKL